MKIFYTKRELIRKIEYSGSNWQFVVMGAQFIDPPSSSTLWFEVVPIE